MRNITDVSNVKGASVQVGGYESAARPHFELTSFVSRLIGGAHIQVLWITSCHEACALCRVMSGLFALS